MTPNFFCISGTGNSLSAGSKTIKKFYRQENFRANVLKQLLTSRASSSTVKRYTLEIRKFVCWSHIFGVEVQLPFDCATITIYFSQCFQQSNSSASLALGEVYSAVKWLHTFVPVTNPLDYHFCRNTLDSAKRIRGKPVSRRHLFRQISLNWSLIALQVRNAL